MRSAVSTSTPLSGSLRRRRRCGRAVWSEHKAQKASGVQIQMGEGHFNRDGKAFHYWDKEKEIPAVCSRCHGANGVAEYLKEGKNTPAPHVKNAFACTNCHADMLSYARHTVARVAFPSGVTVDSGHNDSNLCMTCHQGRESTASVTKAIDGLDADKPDPKLAFLHVHYYPAGATLITYELGGPDVRTFKELMEFVLSTIERRRLLVPIPFAIAALQASVLQFLPRPPITPDQVELLKRDNVVSREAKHDGRTLAALGIDPASIEAVVPTYLRDRSWR
jgi:hypothetical protein